MKRILSLVLCLVMACATLGLVSCSGEVETLAGKTPEELYQDAMDKVKGLTNYTITATQVITADNQTMNQSVVAKKDGKNEYVVTENDMAPSAEMETWYVNEMLYTIMGGTRAKAAISYEKYVEEYMPDGATGDGALMNIPADWFVDTSFHQDGDKYYLEFIVSGEEYIKYFESTALAGYLDGLEDISYKVYFTEDGELGDIVTEFDMVIEGVEAHCVSTSVITDIGKTTITPPSNPDSFTDVTGRI